MKRTLALLACLVPLAAWLPSNAAAAGGLETAIFDPATLKGPEAVLGFARIQAAGATKVRLVVDWPSVAPSGPTKPAGFDPTDPADPNYDWDYLDQEVQLAAAYGLDPILCVQSTPEWAQRSSSVPGLAGRPDPLELGSFAEAAARRYNGDFQGLPPVRYWQVWNEPNLPSYLSPQARNGKTVSPRIYRAMLYPFAAAVRAVNGANRVIAGGLAPFTTPRGTAPMVFMRQLLCMAGRAHPHAVCSKRASFDIWSTHPYTSGGPSHHAAGPDDVSLGDLPQMRRLLAAARRAGQIDSIGAVPFWVTEFSWDTKPPDTHGVPLYLHARWVAEAVYRMWRSGVSLVTWFLLRDYPNDGRLDPQVFQSGLYFHCSAGLECGSPKPALSAFRFPFVALRSGIGVFVWGRTPAGQPEPQVLIERRTPSGWTPVATLSTDQHGIFQQQLQTSQGGQLRAEIATTLDSSRPFTLLKQTPDMLVNPFG